MINDVLGKFTSDPVEQRRLRRRMKKMFGAKLKRRPDQSLAGWRETLTLMAKCAAGGDGELKSKLGVSQMTVFPVLDVWYWTPMAHPAAKARSSHRRTHWCKGAVASDLNAGAMATPLAT